MLKKIGVLLLVLIGLFIFVANFSEKETVYTCNGTLTRIDTNTKQEQSTMYMKLTEYRWWVHLWSDSDGNLKVELPSTTFEYYGNVQKIWDQYQFSDYKGNLKGYFSDLSKIIQLEIGKREFNGKCELSK